MATDFASFERLGRVGDCIGERKLLINIDHHASNTRYGDLNWIEEAAPSTGELILSLLHRGRWPVTPGIADCLFAAVSTDTGSFRYPSTRPDTFRVAGGAGGARRRSRPHLASRLPFASDVPRSACCGTSTARLA